MRDKIYKIIEPGSYSNRLANIYDLSMIVVILLSFVPLMVKEETSTIEAIDILAATAFIIDYILRWMTADYKLKKKGIKAFLLYPLTPMAIIDLLSILPVIALIHPAFRLWRFVRLIKALRILRVIRIFRYSRNVHIIINVFRKQKQAFLMVLIMTLGYIFISAAVMFQVEPDTFDDFLDAIYWAVIMLTTIGYGDVVATTVMGKVITIISALMGVAVIALPAGLITAGYLTEVQSEAPGYLDEVHSEASEYLDDVHNEAVKTQARIKEKLDR